MMTRTTNRLDEPTIRALLKRVAAGEQAVDEAVAALRRCRSRTWVSPRWTTTASCAGASPK